MAAPNIVNVTTITGKSVGAALTASSVDILTNSAGSGKVFKINSIYVANIDGTNSADATVAVYKASASASYRLAYQITVPSKSTLDAVSKPIYLEEGDKIQSLASAVSRLEIIVSYEELS